MSTRTLKIFHKPPCGPYYIPCFDRSAEDIGALMEHERKKGRAFLAQQARRVARA